MPIDKSFGEGEQRPPVHRDPLRTVRTVSRVKLLRVDAEFYSSVQQARTVHMRREAGFFVSHSSISSVAKPYRRPYWWFSDRDKAAFRCVA